MSLVRKLPLVRGLYRENVILAKSNWFNVGGAAEIVFKPKDVEDLIYFIKNKPNNISYTVIGCGSNLIVRDKGIKGVVIKLGREFTNCAKENNQIVAGAGCLSYNLSIYARDNLIGGLEFLSGIPGTVGGNLAMNAGAYGNDISSILIKAQAIDDEGNIHILNKSDMGYIYRGNNIPESWIFTRAIFEGFSDSYDNIEQKIQDISKKRKETQPVREKTSGSTFKNPDKFKAWQLIDEAGCRGLRVGGAVVSDMHCNFLINDQSASASDIENLGKEIKKRVKEKFNIDLEWEIKIIGDS